MNPRGARSVDGYFLQKRAAPLPITVRRLPVLLGATATAAALAGVWMKGADRRAIRRSFAAWAAGDGSFYDLMDDDAEVVLAGTARHAGRYRKDVFMREVAGPLMARFATPPVPTLRRLWASGEGVVAQADAVGVTRDRQHYAQSYVFVFDMARGRIARVTEYLDMAAFNVVWDRIDPAPPPGASPRPDRTR